MSIPTEQIILPPVRMKVDDADVDILEALRLDMINGDKLYYVTCRIRWRGIKTKKFFVICRDKNEFVEKIRIELSKLKTMYLTLGLKETVEIASKW